MLKVILKFYDKYNPDHIFYPGDLIEVEDKERELDLLKRGIVAEAIPFVIRNLKSDESDVDELSVKEIKNILNENGIEYSQKAKKDELIKLLEKVKEAE